MRARPSLPPFRGYGFSEFLEFTEASKSELIHWSATGLIVPGVKRVKGRGRNLWSFRNLFCGAIAAHLNDFGMPLNVTRQVLDKVEWEDLRAQALLFPRSGVPGVPWTEEQRQRFDLAGALQSYHDRDPLEPLSRYDYGYAKAYGGSAESQKFISDQASAWEAMKDPTNRTEAYISFASRGDDDRVHVILGAPVDDRVITASAVVLNLNWILRELEHITGDHWHPSDRFGNLDSATSPEFAALQAAARKDRTPRNIRTLERMLKGAAKAGYTKEAVANLREELRKQKEKLKTEQSESK